MTMTIFAMSLAFFYVKIHCGATGCDACHFSLSQQKRKRYQIIGQYVANHFTHRTAQITMSQLLRLKKNYFNNSRIPLYNRIFCFVFPRGFFVLATIQVRGLEEMYTFLCVAKTKSGFLSWGLFELYLNRWGPRQYVTNISRWNSSFAWGEKDHRKLYHGCIRFLYSLILEKVLAK